MDRKINLTTTDVEALRRLVANLEPTTPTPLHERAVAVTIVQSSELVRFAQQIIKLRSNRTKQFKPSMFGEPAWDMLLVLYANGDQNRLTVGRLALLSGTKATTAIRWLDYLSREEFILRRRNFHDARSEFVELTDKGRSAMDEYLSETLGLLR